MFKGKRSTRPHRNRPRKPGAAPRSAFFSRARMGS